MRRENCVQFLWLCYLVTAVVIAQNITVNSISSKDESLPVNSSDSNNVPYVFPQNNQTGPPIHCREELTENLTLSESEDMRSKSLCAYQNGNNNVNQTETKEEKPFSDAAALENDPKSDAEYIENDVEKTEDGRLQKEDVYRRSHGPGVPLVRGQLAAILAGIFVILAIMAYVGLLSWRRFLENRYGNREMLINEEEFCSPSDMRNFSL